MTFSRVDPSAVLHPFFASPSDRLCERSALRLAQLRRTFCADRNIRKRRAVTAMVVKMMAAAVELFS
jgi:hypothetical protein